MCFAQYQIKGTLKPFDKEIKWAMLYQIKEGRQHYIKNSKIDNRSFYFELPQSASSGMYRVVYRLKEDGFIDFLYNKEDISFNFDPKNPDQTIVYLKSKENILYQSYLQQVLGAQQYLDSIQISYFKKPNPVVAKDYQIAYKQLKELQKKYQKDSYGMLAFNFIKATQRFNSNNAVLEPQEYLENIKNNFFEYINFKDPVLVNSSFLVDRTIDYIFSLSYSKSPEVQESLYKESIKNVMGISKNIDLQKDLIEIVIEEFISMENRDMVIYLVENYYKKLPLEQQSQTYIKNTLSKVSIFVGAVAPNFKWEKNKELYTLNTHKYYVILFWSTGCSHCITQLPEVYKLLKQYKDIQVIAVALEKEAKDWEKLTPHFKGWQHVLGMGKWTNDVARSYNIEATPTYILLNANKRIIALPDGFKALKEALSLLK